MMIMEQPSKTAKQAPIKCFLSKNHGVSFITVMVFSKTTKAHYNTNNGLKTSHQKIIVEAGEISQ